MVNVTDSCFFIRGYKSVPLLFTVPLFFLILATGCTDPKPEPLEQQYFNADSLAPFVEPEFPFITTSVDARNLGAGFPPDNVATRCLALQLGNRAYACFDTDLLRWSVAWTGDFLSMVTMPQVSYRDFHNKGNDFPVVLGEPQLATGIYPGWSVGSPKFNDPRPPSPGPAQISWGPIPREQGRWNGIYLSGKNAVLSYTVGQTEIHELPGSVSRGGITAFTRTFLVDPGSDTLSLVAAEHQGAARSEQRGKAAILYHNTAEDTVTAIGVAGQGDGVRIDFHHNRYATMSLPPRSEKREVTLLVWSGPAGKLDTFRQLIEHTTVQVPDYQKGTEPYWRQTVRTRVQQSPDTAAFVADKLTLPIPNPWKRNVRAVDIAFFDALKGAVVTYDGDVWIVDGINRELPVMEWTRFASGLYGPQSIEIVDGKIYVFGREGIVRLHDLNSDGVADYYENFSNLMAQSMETREWPGSLVAAPGGGFYVSKGAAGNAGPQYNPVAVNGFRYGSRHSGSVLYISADGRSVKQVATGLRMPYLGIHPETGVVTASDQQGHFVPSSPLFLVDEDDYYGVPASAHTEPIPEITPPLLWFPHSVEPSGAGQVWISSRFMGPLNGELVHLSYGRPGLFRILFDSTESHVQGGASLIPARYTAPTMKGAVNPGDGQLYVTGFSLWGANTEELSALLRIRHTGKPAYLPERFKLRDGGIFLRFGHRLDQVSATNPGNYQVKRWSYKRTENYGSGHYKLNDTPGEELLPVFSAHVSEDGKGLFLAVPDMKPSMQIEISYKINAADGYVMNNRFWATAHDLPPANLNGNGFPNLNIEELLLSASRTLEANRDEEEQEISLERGRQLFRRTGCIGCHSIDGTEKGYYGPSMQDLFGSARSLDNGTKATADSAYIRESILYPERKIVEGYGQEMPSFVGILTDDEIASITQYIRSLNSGKSSSP